MINFFKGIFDFLRKYPGIFYSLVLIILIPLALYYNTSFTIKSFQENIDFNLQTKALMAESIFDVFASDLFISPEILQEKIQEIVKENPEIGELKVAKEEQEGHFQIIASTDAQEISYVVADPGFSLSWSQDQTIANLISKEGKRFWKVIKPIYHQETQEKLGLISLTLSLEEADMLITQSVYRSYLIVGLTIALSLFLIIQHTHLFGYVALSKRLQELDRMKDNFIRMATHELQSPIVNIKGYIGALEEETRSLLNETQKEYFSRIKVSAKSLSDLIYDILEVSRIEQGRLDFTPQKILPAPLIKEVVSELRGKAEQKNLDLIFEAKEEPYLLNVNKNRFRQILVNLIENAIKYTLEGEVRVSTEANEAQKRYLIFIKDTGLGIPAEAQQRLFERFYRVKTKETANISGTGLGLWITKQICERMGGQIFVESMAGVGSKFTVVFPLVKV